VMGRDQRTTSSVSAERSPAIIRLTRSLACLSVSGTNSPQTKIFAPHNKHSPIELLMQGTLIV